MYGMKRGSQGRERFLTARPGRALSSVERCTYCIAYVKRTLCDPQEATNEEAVDGMQLPDFVSLGKARQSISFENLPCHCQFLTHDILTSTNINRSISSPFMLPAYILYAITLIIALFFP
jgi:hypothetical protein